jgi:hypothetical protein
MKLIASLRKRALALYSDAGSSMAGAPYSPTDDLLPTANNGLGVSIADLTDNNQQQENAGR